MDDLRIYRSWDFSFFSHFDSRESILHVQAMRDHFHASIHTSHRHYQVNRSSVYNEITENLIYTHVLNVVYDEFVTGRFLGYIDNQQARVGDEWKEENYRELDARCAAIVMGSSARSGYIVHDLL